MSKDNLSEFLSHSEEDEAVVSALSFKEESKAGDVKFELSPFGKSNTANDPNTTKK